ncbi:MAG: NAD(P)-dependent glycerol-3-phosphate dehydrogenase [Synergistaceae bacterium]|jgi:glycerol-3-phosphate dehydrogenase (NAD(P)+)|nr:NAD(P)-dependent glycerol-3-phosphate dehydrogenase [Synergistaceae bacterium]
MNLAILGAGSFGTAMAAHGARLGYDVRLWCRTPAQAEAINRTRMNPRYQKGHKLGEEIRADSDFRKCAAFAENIVLAVPAQNLRDVLTRLASDGVRNRNLLSLAKGMEISSGKLPHQIAKEVLADSLSSDSHSSVTYSALSGPSHAEEVIRDLPTAVVVASESREAAQEWQKILNSPHFRVYTNGDLLGVELGGAVKNVIAIAVGISESLNFGDNAKAALATRGMAEIIRLGTALGASPLTLAGLAGAGDLMVTCYSHHSRNLRFGLAVGRGLSAEEAASEIGQVVEGAHTAKALVAYARRAGIELPIAEGVYAVVHEGASIEQTIEKLLFRDPKPEQPGTQPESNPELNLKLNPESGPHR